RDDKLGRRFATFFSTPVREQGEALTPGVEVTRTEPATSRQETATSPRCVTAKDALRLSLLGGERDDAVTAARTLLDGGTTVVELIEETLVPAMREVGERFERGELFLPHIVLAAEAAQAVFGALPLDQREAVSSRGKVVIATVEGDVHDIGKNLVAMMLRTRGYEVVDLGKSVPGSKVIERAQELNADIVALSALLTTTMVRMKDVVRMLGERRMRSVVLVGGAPVSEDFARRIGAEFAPNAVEAVKKADELMKRASKQR
ncbi:MAG: corrinoid protein, partial [Candidatus Eisenbacteria bacterium]